ncbi:hypothetical protein E2C01_067181 [Portunus trituberculatus]|uniref:Uncharacterized protein n=1 Tax=Portunus trituberculatus TaxID=210409 RepID=A0A5B7HUC5_PORTR|nr:hypothetical protein [Portunus trituberculatus]
MGLTCAGQIGDLMPRLSREKISQGGHPLPAEFQERLHPRRQLEHEAVGASGDAPAMTPSSPGRVMHRLFWPLLDNEYIFFRQLQAAASLQRSGSGLRVGGVGKPVLGRPSILLQERGWTHPDPANSRGQARRQDSRGDPLPTQGPRLRNITFFSLHIRANNVI